MTPVVSRGDAAIRREPLDVGRLARAIKALIRDFTWESENVRLDVVVGPVPYGPAAWTIGGNPDGNIALALAHEYEQAGIADHREAFRLRLASDPTLANTGRILAHFDAAREDVP